MSQLDTFRRAFFQSNGLLFFIILITLANSPLWAQTDPLTERGIDPTILDVMVSSLSQEMAYKQEAEIRLTTPENDFVDRALLIYDPWREYGIDLYLKFSDDDLQTMAPRKFRNMLENRMKLQHRLRTAEFQYDPDTIEVESQTGDQAVIKFRYRKTALPQAVNYMRFLQGRVWVDGDRVVKMRLELDEGRTFRADSQKVSRFEMEGHFERMANGEDLLVRSNSLYTAKYYGLRLFKWGTEFTVEFNTRALSYSDREGNVVFTAPDIDIPVELQDEDQLTEVRVKLDRTFPIYGKQIRSMGFDVPRPFGLSVMYNEMNVDMDFTSFEINGEQEVIEQIFTPDNSGIEVNSVAPQVRGDWFILPFLNVMVIGGTASAEGDLNVNVTELGQLLGLPPVLTGTIDLDLTMYGFGLTAAAGYNNFIGAMTYTWVNTITSGANTESQAQSFTALAGYQLLDWRMNLLFGPEYLSLNKKMTGAIDTGGGDLLEFNIGTETEAWAWRAGIHKELGNHWELVASYTFGADRDGYNLMLGYRW